MTVGKDPSHRRHSKKATTVEQHCDGTWKLSLRGILSDTDLKIYTQYGIMAPSRKKKKRRK